MFYFTKRLGENSLFPGPLVTGEGLSISRLNRAFS